MVYFLPALYGSKSAFWKFHSAGTYVITLPHNNIQVTIFVRCLNFAGTRSQILLSPVSLCCRMIPSRKISLNFNREISYRELARRPWYRWCETLPLKEWKSCMHMYGDRNRYVIWWLRWVALQTSQVKAIASF